MQVTEVRVKLMGRQSERLKAFCSVTFDGEFVVRDVKVIEGTNGLFVAMPSRQLSDRCPMCRNKNTLRARFCSECGARLDESRATRNEQGRLKLHVDIAHPINAACREAIEKVLLEAYQQEVERSDEPGYEPEKLDLDEVDYSAGAGAHPSAPAEPAGQEKSEVAEQAKEESVKEEAPTDEATKEDEGHSFGQGIL
ncbi:MAG: septation protein SpoVG family protein [Phycisphaerae bacterium]|nr:septation protein SpoVG family protein [Phycisphaerae bacterium]